MTLRIRDLSVLAYANGFTLWHCKAMAETQAAIGRRGNFNSATDMLAAGDMVIISASDGGRVVSILSDDTAVTVAPLA